jgi:hypothetical protein
MTSSARKGQELAGSSSSNCLEVPRHREILVRVEVHARLIDRPLFTRLILKDGAVDLIRVSGSVLPGGFPVGRAKGRIIAEQIRIARSQTAVSNQNPNRNAVSPDAGITTANVPRFRDGPLPQTSFRPRSLFRNSTRPHRGRLRVQGRVFARSLSKPSWPGPARAAQEAPLAFRGTWGTCCIRGNSLAFQGGASSARRSPGRSHAPRPPGWLSARARA